MQISSSIQGQSFTESLSSMADAPMLGYGQFQYLKEAVVPHLSALQGVDIHNLKIISSKFKKFAGSKPNTAYMTEVNTSLIAIDVLTDYFDRHQTVYETLLFFQQYPLDIIDQIVQRTALALLSRRIEHLAINTWMFKTVKEKHNLHKYSDIITTKKLFPMNTKEQDYQNQLRYYATISQKSSLALFYLACKSSKYLRVLSLPIVHMTQEEISTIVKECSEIEAIKLRYWGPSDGFPMRDVAHLKKLKILKLPDDVRGIELVPLPFLESIFMDCRGLKETPLFSQYSGLKTIHLTVHHHSLLSILEINRECLGAQETLKFEIDANQRHYPHNFYLEYLSEIAKVPILKKLSIIRKGPGFFYNNLDKEALHILATCRALETLHLDFVRPLNFQGLDHLLTSLPNLKHLILETWRTEELNVQYWKDKFPGVNIEFKLYPT